MYSFFNNVQINVAKVNIAKLFVVFFLLKINITMLLRICIYKDEHCLLGYTILINRVSVKKYRLKIGQ